VTRLRFSVTGVVQGVGFRPFVHGLARRHDLAGFVRNDAGMVVVEAEGEQAALDAFARELLTDAPPLARIGWMATDARPATGERGFAIVPSAGGTATGAGGWAGGRAPLPPDVATCDDCLRELFDPGDRRFRHAFITCTQCGPRFTIACGLPYDRATTTMASFTLCDDCRREYEDPGDRRFHAETIACPRCGPRLSLALPDAVEVLRDGGILAVKGLGGYHLACLAGDEAAVARLRERKRREEKPFAVMTTEPDRLAFVGAQERLLLRSPARPIVLLARRPQAPIAASVAPGSPWLGVLAPYTPLHHLLLDDAGEALVMTSGNRGDEPIAIDDDDARGRLAGIADAILAHNRPIHRRCEDSVVRAAFPVRRSRGHAPDRLALPRLARRTVVGAGAERKSTFCVARGRQAWLSSHLGDLNCPAAVQAFREDLELHLAMLGLEPDVVACDLHPDYASTRWAHDQDAELVEVQHHHAHAAACLAEHGETGPALALVFDGTGFGADGTLWGGELLRCDLERYERVAHLEPVPLPGGDAAIREPWRAAASYLERAGRPVPFEAWATVRQSLRVNAPLSSGMGRLFDAVAALVCVREHCSYEGQAAIELEQLAAGVAAQPYDCSVGGGVIAGVDLVRQAHDDLAAGRPREQIAAAFHEGVAEAAVRACEQSEQRGLVVLSGGTFQNLRLLGSVRRGLEARDFTVLSHRLVPPNDGGVSYGQAAVAAARCS
jgi:hydrogenase maturation protein HypF